MTYKRFYEITKNLDRNKYHTCFSFKQGRNCGDWVIFRKDMSWEEYWSEDNKPILDSKYKTEEDLINFCKNGCIV